MKGRRDVAMYIRTGKGKQYFSPLFSSIFISFSPFYSIFERRNIKGLGSGRRRGATDELALALVGGVHYDYNSAVRGL